MSSVAQQKRLVEQLRVESNVQRTPLSQSLHDLINFTEVNKNLDPLIVGIDKKANPFVEKSSCNIL